MKYANVIVDITHAKLDKVFQYKIPEDLQGKLHPGIQVNIPFGNGKRMIRGFAVELTDESNYDIHRLKEIDSIVEEGIDIESRLIELAAWMKEHYGGTLIQALKTVLPVKQKIKHREKRYVKLLVSLEKAAELKEHYHKKSHKARERLLARLIEEQILPYEVVTKELNITSIVMKGMLEQEIVEVLTEQVYRNPVGEQASVEARVDLNEEQLRTVERIENAFEKGERRPHLIHGITGSGKTEVYMELISSMIEKGKQAIVLIPEIALTYQTVMRFYKRFGERVSFMNSKLSPGERYDQYLRAKNGEIDIMIGPRSALFAPFTNLGLIIVDEEHEGSYKSETVPRYHARETAVKRAEMEGAYAVFGSATPSVDAYYKGETGEYHVHKLFQRANMMELPQVYTTDMREELKKGNKSILGEQLRGLIEDRLGKKQQIILFLNRRGYAGFVSCRACGYVLKCKNCDVSLADHNNRRMVCHYCGYEERLNRHCTECGSAHLSRFWAGTQQVEEYVQEEFPKARVLRMDADTTKGKDGYTKILEEFSSGEADILIGTQMIVKGHDFPLVTLVGVLAADLSLHVSDFRASERTFQLLTQAAGRAGRGEYEGEVVVQSYDPEHYAIQAAIKQDYKEFYEKEISYRELMDYPPAYHMLAIYIGCKDKQLIGTAADYLKKTAALYGDKHKAHIIGPADAPIARISNVYRKMIYIKHEEYDSLIKIKNYLEKYIEINEGFKQVMVQFDFDPLHSF